VALNPRSILWTSLALLFSALCVTVWIQVEPVLNPAVTVVATTHPDCDLRAGPCMAVFPDGALVRFAISPANIPAAVPLRLEIGTEGIDARGVEVDFTGADMNMGFNRISLDSVGLGKFSGMGMLPMCVRSRMTWEARVLLHTDTGLLAAPFRFDTYLLGKGPPAGSTPTGNKKDTENRASR